MKIAVVGCGAVGGYYGALLSRAGEDAHFLLRSDYSVVRQNGVHIHSPRGDFTAHPKVAATPEEVGLSDLVVIALKTTANAAFARLLPPLVGPQTALLTLQNGLGNEAALAQLFPRNHIFGGLCFVCVNRLAPGVIQHLDHGLIVLGEFRQPPSARLHEVAAVFQRAEIVCRMADDLARAHWEKLVWNIPFNGLGVASAAGYDALTTTTEIATVKQPCRTTDQLLDGGRWEILVRELMLEVITAANALGHQLEEELVAKMIERTRTMGAYKASTVLDFEYGRPLELQSLFLEPLRQAQAADVSVPRLTALCCLLERLNP